MRTVAGWLDRLATLNAEKQFSELHFRVFVPGSKPLDIDRWLLTTFPQKPYPQAYKSGVPESLSVARIIDQTEATKSVFDTQRLLAELAAIFSLALDRRVEIPFEIAALVQDTGRLLFTPYGQVSDRSILGPLPADQLSSLSDILGRVRSLPSGDATTLGDATSLIHASMLIFDQEPRSAYTLLVAALEVLSRAYGTPPTDWSSWEDAETWDARFATLLLSAEQASTLRQQLMEDKHLRLKATFRSYCSARPTPQYWEHEYTEWMYPLHAHTGVPLEPPITRTRRIGETLPTDRAVLARCLGYSYDLRSQFVHRGHWVGPTDLISFKDDELDPNAPLPFNLLRQLTTHLVLCELHARSSPTALPDVQLLRNLPEGAA